MLLSCEKYACPVPDPSNKPSLPDFIICHLGWETQTAMKPGPHELMGFLLRQSRSAIEGSLGKPFNQQEADGWMGSAYRVQKVQDTYLVVFYGKKDRILKMELTGSDYTGPTGFYGLRLGDSAEKVQAVLGKPTTISHEADVNVDLWDYKGATYSVEISASHKLYSIQILDDDETRPSAFPGGDAVYSFAKAYAAHDMDVVMAGASGEMECSDTKDYGIQTGEARKLISDDKSAISQCLQRAASAILAIGQRMSGSDDSIRIWPDTGRAGAVVKLPAASPLAEVVFVFETGGWRIYEIKFRQKGGSGKSTP